MKGGRREEAEKRIVGESRRSETSLLGVKGEGKRKVEGGGRVWRVVVAVRPSRGEAPPTKPGQGSNRQPRGKEVSARRDDHQTGSSSCCILESCRRVQCALSQAQAETQTQRARADARPQLAGQQGQRLPRRVIILTCCFGWPALDSETTKDTWDKTRRKIRIPKHALSAAWTQRHRSFQTTEDNKSVTIKIHVKKLMRRRRG